MIISAKFDVTPFKWSFATYQSGISMRSIIFDDIQTCTSIFYRNSILNQINKLHHLSSDMRTAPSLCQLLIGNNTAWYPGVHYWNHYPGTLSWHQATATYMKIGHPLVPNQKLAFMTNYNAGFWQWLPGGMPHCIHISDISEKLLPSIV